MCSSIIYKRFIKVIVGENDISDAEQTKLEVSQVLIHLKYKSSTYMFSQVMIHPNYSSSTYNNDFSILRLTSPLSFSSSISPICLPSDTSATFAGKVIKSLFFLSFFMLSLAYIGGNSDWVGILGG